MTTRYLFEVSRHRPIEPEEPLEMGESFYLDLTQDQLEGVHFLGRHMGVIAVNPFLTASHIRVYQENPIAQVWVPYVFPLPHELPSHNWMEESVPILPQDTPEDVFQRLQEEIAYHEAMLPRYRAPPKKRYLYVVRSHPQEEPEFFTSDTLGTLQGMMSVADWLGKDWYPYILYIFENGAPMEVAG